MPSLYTILFSYYILELCVVRVGVGEPACSLHNARFGDSQTLSSVIVIVVLVFETPHLEAGSIVS